MKGLLRFTLISLLGTLPLSAGSSVVFVPAAHRSGGGFVKVQSNAYRATEDKARAVIDEVLLFTGAKNAWFKVSTDSNVVEVSGPALIQVGGHPRRLQLGPTILEAKSATLVVQTENDRVLVMLKKTATSGYARVESAHGAALMRNAPYLLSIAGATPAPAARQTLEKQYTALTGETREASLSLFDPAAPEDYRLRPSLGRSEDGADIEIEAVEIEIEPGCIEVCQD